MGGGGGGSSGDGDLLEPYYTLLVATFLKHLKAKIVAQHGQVSCLQFPSKYTMSCSPH